MPTDRLDRFHFANRELRSFLERVDALVHGTSDVGPGELRAIGRVLEDMAPEISHATTSVSDDAALQAQIHDYVANLRALQASLEQVRCVMFARLTQIQAARQHMHGVQGWANAYGQTA